MPPASRLSTTLRGRAGAIGATAVVLGLLAKFAGDGLRAYFTPDDMMNLYGAWFQPLSSADRPLGALYYRAMFAGFGLNPLAYRVTCMVFLLANLALLYGFCMRAARSREIAAIACLLGAYHAHLADLYYSTGTVYDLLCGIFYLSAFLYYARVREAGRPGWGHIAVVLLGYAAALNAKEMAITLPAVILLYDLIYHAPKWGWRAVLRWSGGELRMLAPAAAVTVALFLRKVAGPGRMIENPDYLPHFAWGVFADAWAHYSNDLLYRVVDFNHVRVAVLWGVLILIACAFRRRVLFFALSFLFVAMLPVAFITPRGFFEIYLTLPGWYLFAAATLVLGRNAILRRLPFGKGQGAKTAAECALFVAVALALMPLHKREKPLGKEWVESAHEQVAGVLAHLGEVAGPLPRGAKVLFLSDPYPKDEWMLTFVFRLFYRDEQLRVDRIKTLHEYPGAEEMAAYDGLFVTDGHALVRAWNGGARP